MEEKKIGSLINKYLNRFAYFDQQINQLPVDDLSMVVVIPSRREDRLLSTLQSLLDAQNTKRPIEILIVFNHPQSEEAELKEKNIHYLEVCKDWISSNGIENIHIIEAFDLPDKHAGVGLARKIGMDEAVRRLGNNEEGIIIALDADCEVEENYLTAIEKAFDDNPQANAASIYFEHPLQDLDEVLLKGIIQYELHLRYYNQLLKYAGHPFAFHTVGSSMAVRSSVYQKQGGMNKRKAGEDFYFLQKIIQLGNFIEIKNTSVYPSARISDRVPFGTGRAQDEWIKGGEVILNSYHPSAGEELKSLFSIVQESAGKTIDIQRIPNSVSQFIGEQEWDSKMDEIASNTNSKEAFIQRFFNWFNLFMCFKFVHYYRDNYKENIAVTEAANDLMHKLGIPLDKDETALELLNKFRKWES